MKALVLCFAIVAGCYGPAPIFGQVIVGMIPPIVLPRKWGTYDLDSKGSADALR